MNKRQSKKMRQLRLENERLRETQKVRLETGFELAKLESRVDELHQEVCRHQIRGLELAIEQDQLEKQQRYLDLRSQPHTKQIQRLESDVAQLAQQIAKSWHGSLWDKIDFAATLILCIELFLWLLMRVTT